MTTYANFDSYEGQIINGDGTIELKRKSRKIIIINDSIDKNLNFKFNPQESYGTLRPNETLSIDDMFVTHIYMQGTGVDYRVWVFG